MVLIHSAKNSGLDFSSCSLNKSKKDASLQKWIKKLKKEHGTTFPGISKTADNFAKMFENKY